MNSVLYAGFDVGSTTIKVAVLSPQLHLLFGRYVRHFSDIHGTVSSLLDALQEKFPHARITAAISGSSGLGLSCFLELPFIQEIIAETKAIRTFHPESDVIIELGGEDAKITYLKGCVDQRMNGACAGGTGAFIDRMASLLSTDPEGLSLMAEKAKNIYPIAARCGVFAKTDIQSLLNEGALHEDIAVSVFQSVVNQTLTGLTCGKPIRGKVAFLGGPLTFLPALRERFRETLHLKDDEMILPEHSELYVAIGAALSGKNNRPFDMDAWIARVKKKPGDVLGASRILPPLFSSEKDYRDFQSRHNRFHTPEKDIRTHHGPCWLGIDAGSTTIKAVLIDADGSILYRYYSNNEGKPLDGARHILMDLYAHMPSDAYICGTGITGYGEGLLKEALHVDTGEVETIAHYKAARHFCPEVTTILDIGGQDMKCCRIKDGAIDSILLNEACSSGCGSFLDTFAQSLHMDIRRFSQLALLAPAPVDLGSRCTVFMNSKIREAQKNNASVADISAGLSYSVIKNALYKVIRLRHAEDLGDRVVVQGGTFYNDAVLRALEKLLGREVIRPDIAGLMGAFGMALTAHEKYSASHRSSIISAETLSSLQMETEIRHCPGCENHCLITLSSFSDGRAFVSGNRCERGESIALTGKASKRSEIPDMYRWKYNRLFSYRPLPKAEAARGTVGIPRALNMYEDYPFWFTFFTSLGYRVLLSSPTNQRNTMAAMETIPSDSECYPTKLVHGHILDLIRKKVDRIWYPCIDKGPNDPGADNTFNCPMVISYPEVIAANMDEALQKSQIPFHHPFLPLHDSRHLLSRLKEELSDWGPGDAEIENAFRSAQQEQKKYENDLSAETKKALQYIKSHGIKGIILAGRPYHIDPAVHHGIPDLIVQLGMAVLTEDCIAPFGRLPHPLRVLNQWSWHSRLYRAAEYVTRSRNLELVELNSFGCGLDAVVTDQVQEILTARHRLYTCVKIDEGLNLGAVRIRLRSLMAAMKERPKEPVGRPYEYHKVLFTKEMTHISTILVPEMAPFHFPLIEAAARIQGYKLVVVKPQEKEAVDTGLSYVNNDACYPAIITIGSLITALRSGKYDLDQTAVMISQTGGGCRASNYLAFLRKAVADAGFGQVPIISFNKAGLDKQPGFSLSFPFIHRLAMAAIYGDALMQCVYRTRPYEAFPGSAETLCRKWMKKCILSLKSGNFWKFSRNIRHIIEDFDTLQITQKLKPKIGIVGEIYVKFHPLANNGIVSAIEGNGGEAVASGIMDFLLYSLLDSKFQHTYLGGSFPRALIDAAVSRVLLWYRHPYEEAVRKSHRFSPLTPIKELAGKASRYLSLGNRAGEGWFLTADMLDMIEKKCSGIVCLQPFGCLPNHVTGKGMIHKLRQTYPEINILALDCDAGASRVNQLNRLKLMMSAILEKNEKDIPPNTFSAVLPKQKGKLIPEK